MDCKTHASGHSCPTFSTMWGSPIHCPILCGCSIHCPTLCGSVLLLRIMYFTTCKPINLKRW